MEYRGFRFEAVDATQLGYRLPGPGGGRPGRGRKINAVHIYDPADDGRPVKTTDTIRQAKQWVDNYLGPIASESRRKSSTAQVHETDRRSRLSRRWRSDPPGSERALPSSESDEAQAMVEIFPYLDSPYDVAMGSVATIEVIFANERDARDFFDRAVRSGTIEKAELRVRRKGYWRGMLIDEYSDTQDS